ncbi:site-specific integrase [Flagellimonas taeanensis]|uniref:site-specific integrase n=1 Tax=Flavobacteriaceae TaxID=49546 RepID=UPI000E69FE82|nr:MULTISPECIES: site-specific integrase [Allomuricauda]MDC6385878.1 site-specific integrase [Muricauda sp. SK9]RIV51111.1 site-specific integrase [Allomuricauda taeanensis]
MKTSHTFSILFWINKSRAINNKAEIFVRITVNGKRANIGIKRKINIDLWDNLNKKVKGKTKESQDINRYLDLVQARLLNIYQDLKYKGDLITPQLVKSLYNGENINSKTLLDLLEYHNRKIENTLAPGTIRNFGITENYINRFLKNNLKTSDVHLRQLNYKFISDLEMFLVNYYPKGHPKAMSHNTVMKHLQRLRKIINLAYQLEWIDRDPFLRWKPTFEQKQREFLNANELSNLENYDFFIERLDRVRDLFVFSCYTGISYSDIMELTDNNLIVGSDGNRWIITKRLKTKTSVRVPLLVPAKKILDKYKNHPVTICSKTLLPKITNEKTNLYLKEIADAVGINKNLTFHMARHTFATTVTLSNGVPIETVSKMLGHTKLSTTQIYARVLDKKLSEDMIALQKKLELKN